jgi:hypothetical protein
MIPCCVTGVAQVFVQTNKNAVPLPTGSGTAWVRETAFYFFVGLFTAIAVATVTFNVT